MLGGFQASIGCVLGGREPLYIWAISSSSASNNQPLLTYIWMYACWDVHQDTYLDIWVRRVIIIRCQDNNLLCCFSTWYNFFHRVLWSLLVSYWFLVTTHYLMSRSYIVCLYSQHDFQCMFMIQIYRYTCAYLRTPFGIRITTHQRVLTPLDPHVQISELRACRFSRMLIRDLQLKRGSSTDRLKPYPSKPPTQL